MYWELQFVFCYSRNTYYFCLDFYHERVAHVLQVGGLYPMALVRALFFEGRGR